MTLINIEYGSLASSETMNKNFIYLEEKIVDTAETITTTVSSMLSNIATLNTRLSDFSEEAKADIDEAIETLTTDLGELKDEIEAKIFENSMLPNWSACVSISTPNLYVSPSNGYLLLLPATTANGDLTVNGVTVRFKNCSSGNDYAAILTPIPVKKGDVITCSTGLSNAYLLPIREGGN